MNLQEMKRRMFRENPDLAIAQAVGEMVRVARTKAGLSQYDLAKKMHTSQPSIARVENGHITASLQFLNRVALATGHKLKMPRFAPLPEQPK